MDLFYARTMRVTKSTPDGNCGILNMLSPFSSRLIDPEYKDSSAMTWKACKPSSKSPAGRPSGYLAFTL